MSCTGLPRAALLAAGELLRYVEGKGSAAMTRVRRNPPPSVRDEVLREAGYKCANPTCRNIITLQLHHIVWGKDDGANEATNLIALCGHCHDLHTQGHIPTSAVRHWKGILHALNHAFSRESMDLLLYLHRPTIENVWYTGDGLLRFSGLIAAGLVEIADSQVSIGMRYGKDSPPTSPPTTAVRVRLSSKGQLLVDAWMKGDEERYVQALKRVRAGSPESSA
jgi:HNH endonuclease